MRECYICKQRVKEEYLVEGQGDAFSHSAYHYCDVCIELSDKEW